MPKNSFSYSISNIFFSQATFVPFVYQKEQMNIKARDSISIKLPLLLDGDILEDFINRVSIFMTYVTNISILKNTYTHSNVTNLNIFQRKLVQMRC